MSLPLCCVAVFGLVLSCGGVAAAASDAPTSPGDELPVAAELLANDALAGTWTEVGDDATIGLLFTAKDFPDTLAIGCQTAAGLAYINWTLSHPANDAEVRIYTLARTEVFSATGVNDAVGIRAIEVAGTDPRLVVLKARQAKFAVQGEGEAIILPWDARIATVLGDCGV